MVAAIVFYLGRADRMADDVLANGQLVVVAQASHSVMLDNPEGFNEALTGFALG